MGDGSRSDTVSSSRPSRPTDDPTVATIWLIRLLFLGLLYLFLFGSSGSSCATCLGGSRAGHGLGRLIVVGSEVDEPSVGATFALDAVATLGRDVNNTVVVDDPFVSTEQAVLSFRGRAWYLEDLDSTNGTFVNGARIDGLAMVAFGDALQVGRVRFRLERAG